MLTYTSFALHVWFCLKRFHQEKHIKCFWLVFGVFPVYFLQNRIESPRKFGTYCIGAMYVSFPDVAELYVIVYVIDDA